MSHAAPNRDELIEWVTKELTPDEQVRLHSIIERWNSKQLAGVEEPRGYAGSGPRGVSPVQLAQLRKALDQVVALAAGIATDCADRQMRELCLRAATQCRLVAVHLQREQLFAVSGR